ncbi:hypothetical protein ABZ234_08670 [Nocardiopsis sp. NPDC006198]|uniref:hypothetical protein n=1 Tax=Nocardiopsis sp. NPDC006198 TaxID=3154472 RepID=UPI0033AEDC34
MYGYDYGMVAAYQVALPGWYLVYAEDQGERHVLWGYNGAGEREGIGQVEGDLAEAIGSEVAQIRARNGARDTQGLDLVVLDEQVPAQEPGYLDDLLEASRAHAAAKTPRAKRAAAIRAMEGLPEDECLYDADAGYESTDCDCPLCDR